MGRDGARPSRGKQWSETTIGALIKTWRASGLSAPRWTMRACLGGKRYASNVAGYVGFRGCKGLQPSKVRNGYEALITESCPSAPCKA
jgi:hypothetical protein